MIWRAAAATSASVEERKAGAKGIQRRPLGHKPAQVYANPCFNKPVMLPYSSFYKSRGNGTHSAKNPYSGIGSQ